MKRILFLSIFLYLSAFSVFAQEIVNTKNFSGSWELDVSKSKLDARSRVTSMMMKVSQTNNEIKIENNVTYSNANQTGGTTDSNGGIYNRFFKLDGKEKEIKLNSATGVISATIKAEFDGNTLKLYQKGSMITKETWTLSADGNTLNVKREAESPRGDFFDDMVFVKKADLTISTSPDMTVINKTQSVAKVRTISGGVVNGKAKNLVVPRYPNEAKAERAGGQVAVAVTIDENGNVISATAVSGHPLLRTAAEEAARASKFYPTTLEGVPVMVTGNIIYNFKP